MGRVGDHHIGATHGLDQALARVATVHALTAAAKLGVAVVAPHLLAHLLRRHAHLGLPTTPGENGRDSADHERDSGQPGRKLGEGGVKGAEGGGKIGDRVVRPGLDRPEHHGRAHREGEDQLRHRQAQLAQRLAGGHALKAGQGIQTTQAARREVETHALRGDEDEDHRGPHRGRDGEKNARRDQTERRHRAHRPGGREDRRAARRQDGGREGLHERRGIAGQEENRQEGAAEGDRRAGLGRARQHAATAKVLSPLGRGRQRTAFAVRIGRGHRGTSLPLRSRAHGGPADARRRRRGWRSHCRGRTGAPGRC